MYTCALIRPLPPDGGHEKGSGGGQEGRRTEAGARQRQQQPSNPDPKATEEGGVVPAEMHLATTRA